MLNFKNSRKQRFFYFSISCCVLHQACKLFSSEEENIRWVRQPGPRWNGQLASLWLTCYSKDRLLILFSGSTGSEKESCSPDTLQNEIKSETKGPEKRNKSTVAVSDPCSLAASPKKDKGIRNLHRKAAFCIQHQHTEMLIGKNSNKIKIKNISDDH